MKSVTYRRHNMSNCVFNVVVAYLVVDVLAFQYVLFRVGETCMDINFPRLAATEDSHTIVAHSEEDQVFSLKRDERTQHGVL